MKILLDFLPIVLFFATFKYAESHKDWAASFASDHLGFLVSGGKVGPEEAPVLLATLVVILATLAQVIFLKLRGRKVDLMLWVSLVLVVTMGGIPIWLNNATFIKWKPSVRYWIMGLVLFVSQTFMHKNLLRSMMGDQLTLPEAVWKRINLWWVLFFMGMGFLNLFVVYNFSTSTWASFKVFGTTGLILVFTLAQGLYLNPYLSGPSANPNDEAQP